METILSGLSLIGFGARPHRGGQQKQGGETPSCGSPQSPGSWEALRPRNRNHAPPQGPREEGWGPLASSFSIWGDGLPPPVAWLEESVTLQRGTCSL